MAEWQDKVWKAGTLVEVFDFDMNLIGAGKLLKDYIPSPPDKDDDKLMSLEEALEIADKCRKCNGSGKVSDDLCDECDGTGEIDWIPEIEMEDGSIILGCDCFWIPIEETDRIKKEHSLADYIINVRAKGYHGFSMNVKVTAKNSDEATATATSKEPRYNEDDPYCLVVYVNEEDEDVSVFCTYLTLVAALAHIKNITDGRWMLIEKDFSVDSDEGVVLRSWDDYEQDDY